MTKRWLRLAGPVLLGLVTGLAGCSSSPSQAGRGATTTTRIQASPPPTTGPAGSATPPLVVAQASVEVSDSTATVTFAGRVVSGPLRATDATFDAAHRQLTFSITGVRYTAGAVSAAGPAGDLIAGVTVSGSGAGVTVRITLQRAGTDHRFVFGRDQVGVHLS